MNRFSTTKVLARLKISNHRRVSVLSTLAILAYVFMIVAFFATNHQSFLLGFYSAKADRPIHEVRYVNVQAPGYDVFPEPILDQKSGITLSKRSRKLEILLPPGFQYPAEAKSLLTGMTTVRIIMFFIPFILPFLFAGVIVAIKEDDIFHYKAIKYTRWIGILLIVWHLGSQVQSYLNFRIDQLILQFSDYQFTWSLGDATLLVVGLSVLLLAEVFSGAMKIKEEQQLTI
jgi:hypothetical protein